MKLTIYHVSLGMESKFDFFSRVWFYYSSEKWFILRLFGIYFWFYPKIHDIKKNKGIDCRK